MRRLFYNLDWKQLAGLGAMLAIVWLLWNTWLVYPLKILVVFFHELSHGAMAVATGGRIEEIQLLAAEGGLCITAGGSQFLTLSAGYLGSLVWGGLVLGLASRTEWDKAIAIVLGSAVVVVGLVFVRPLLSFGFAFCALAGTAVAASGVYLPLKVNDFILKLVGLVSCLYAVLDIKSDILDRPEIRSDARMLAELTGLPTILWGLTWIAIAAPTALFFLLFASRKKEGTPNVEQPIAETIDPLGKKE